MSNHQTEVFEEHIEENEFERRSGEDLQSLSLSTQIYNAMYDIAHLQGQLQAIVEIESHMLNQQIRLQIELRERKAALKELEQQQDAENMGSPFDK